MYDVTNRESFDNIKTLWAKKAELPPGTNHEPLVVRMLIGNKAEEQYEDGVERVRKSSCTNSSQPIPMLVS